MFVIDHSLSTAGVKPLHAKLDLVCKLFIVKGINTSLNGADDHMVQSDMDTEHIFDDDEIFEGFTTEDFAVAMENLQTVFDMP